MRLLLFSLRFNPKAIYTLALGQSVAKPEEKHCSWHSARNK